MKIVKMHEETRPGNPKILALRKFIKEWEEFHRRLFYLLDDIRIDAQDVESNTSRSDLVDIGYLLRELTRYIDETRKESQSKHHLVGRKIALGWLQDNINSSEIDDVLIRGQLATGTVKIERKASVPSRGTEEYYQMGEYFGIPQEVLDAGLIKFSFQQTSEWLTNLQEEGKNPPDFVKKTFDDFAVQYRKKNKK